MARRSTPLRGLAPPAIGCPPFGVAAKIACEAASRFAVRYAELAEEMQAAETDPVRKEELERIAQVCRQVSTGPARSFHEALQLSWFLHLWVCLENGEAAGAFAEAGRYQAVKGVAPGTEPG